MATQTGAEASPVRPDRLALTAEEVLTTTRSVRKRLDFARPVDRTVVEECLRLAFQAPNADNLQLWDWILVDDPDQRQAVGDVYRAAIDSILVGMSEWTQGGPAPDLVRMGIVFDFADPGAMRVVESAMYLHSRIHEAPVLVVPTVRARLDSCSIFEQATLWGSVLPGMWSLMMALRTRGLGSAWTTAHLRQEEQMAKVLGIPFDQVTQAGLLPVAYTIGTDFKPAPRHGSESTIHWNNW